MATLNMDRILQACVTQGASDIHITVGRPPVLRIDGHLRSLETKVLDPDDTSSLMKSITPDRCQQELQEEGSTDYGFAFGDGSLFGASYAISTHLRGFFTLDGDYLKISYHLIDPNDSGPSDADDYDGMYERVDCDVLPE